MTFHDRRDAGRYLAGHLTSLAAQQPIVVSIPRGGVPVGAEVALALGAPLDILAVRKLGAPANPEFAFGAVAEDGAAVVNPDVAHRVGVDSRTLDAILARESQELHRRVAVYRGRRARVDVRGRTVIVVDDGLATGLTDLAAVRALRRRGAAQIVVAAPVGSRQAIALLEEEADRVVCDTIPPMLDGVGRWYADFSPVDDAEVIALLEASGAAQRGMGTRELELRVDGITLQGDLSVPPEAQGLVLFAHGSGSSRHSPRNRAVAKVLQDAGFATLLTDLLGPGEEHHRELVFDIPLLAGRVGRITRWALDDPATTGLPIGYFGASTGAAAALHAAAEFGPAIRAVVSRGGRPDLASDRLAEVLAPTLLIVGEADREVLALNRQAAEHLRCPKQIEIVPGAGHLFEEPGGLESVAALARAWFSVFLVADGAALAATVS